MFVCLLCVFFGVCDVMWCVCVSVVFVCIVCVCVHVPVPDIHVKIRGQLVGAFLSSYRVGPGGQIRVIRLVASTFSQAWLVWYLFDLVLTELPLLCLRL